MDIRKASYEDMPLAADIMVTSFRTAFVTFVSPKTMDACARLDACTALLQQAYRDGMHFLMGGKQGFLCWQENGRDCELVALHTLPESWGTGLGHRLLTELLRQTEGRGLSLWVFKENDRARRFYEKHGFFTDGTERVSEFDGATELRYVRSAVQLHPATAEDLETVLAMQWEAFADLLEIYQDYDMSPATESREKVLWKLTHPGSYYYFIRTNCTTVGGIRIAISADGVWKRISPLYILPSFRGRGYAQAAMLEAERIHGSDNWTLDTILQEIGNCYLYEKLGYRQTGHLTPIKKGMTIVDYIKSGTPQNKT